MDPLPEATGDDVARHSLVEIQRWMQWIITEPRGVDQALASPWTTDPSLTKRYKEPTRQLGAIAEAAPLSTRDRLSVYAGAYFYRLLESLAADYPTVRRVLGEERFQDVVAHYLMRHPSDSPNIGDVGEAFAEFIQRHPLSQWFPFLHDLAALERAVMECLFLHHLPALDVRSFQTKSEDEWAAARFVLDPAIRFVTVRWRVDALWRNREQAEPLDLPREPDSVTPRLLIYRDNSWVRMMTMDIYEWTALRMLQKRRSLGTVCDVLSKHRPDETDALPVMEWFSTWVTNGLIREVLWDPSKEHTSI